MAFQYGTQAKVIADSITPQGVRLTTLEVTFHRFILAEVNTHRKLSRNSASSRAIPLEKMLERAMAHPAIFISWPREQPGMSGGTQLEDDDFVDAYETLEHIRNMTTKALADYIKRHPDKSTRLHKSLLNRPLEWFMWHTAIVSSTEWENLLKQRISPDAQPEFNELAEHMREALEMSKPRQLEYGHWHLPYVDNYAWHGDNGELTIPELIKISTARCARVSYLTHDGIRDAMDDIRMHDETLWSKGHWSPMEHPAMCVPKFRLDVSSNFDDGWVQYRYFAEHGIFDRAQALSEMYFQQRTKKKELETSEYMSVLNSMANGD